MKKIFVYIAFSIMNCGIVYFVWDEAWVRSHENFLMACIIPYSLFWIFYGNNLLERFVNRIFKNNSL